MIKYIVIALFTISILSAACSNSTEEGYRIEFTLDGEVPKEAYLGYYMNKTQYVADTTQSNNGTFVFEGDERLPYGMYILIVPPELKYFDILMGEDQHFEVSTHSESLMDSLVITNSEVNNEFISYVRFFQNKQLEKRGILALMKEANKEEVPKLAERLEKLDAEVMDKQEELIAKYDNTVLSTFIKASLNVQVPEAPDSLTATEQQEYQFKYYKKHYFDNLELSNPAIIRTPFYATKIDNYFDNLVPRQAGSLITESEWLIDRSSGNDETYRFMLINLINRFAHGVTDAEERAYAHLGLEYYTDTLKTPWINMEERLNIVARAQIIDSLQTLKSLDQ